MRAHNRFLYSSMLALLAVAMTGCHWFKKDPRQQLSGSWSAECTKIGEDRSLKVTLTFREMDYIRAQTVYGDDNCVQPGMVVKEKGVYTVGGAPSVAGSDSVDVDLKRVRETWNVFDSAMHSKFEENSVCGFSYWPLAEDVDVSGRRCNGDLIPTGGTKTFHIVHVKGDKLYLGALTAERDGTKREMRPLAINEDNAYVKLEVSDKPVKI